MQDGASAKRRTRRLDQEDAQIVYFEAGVVAHGSSGGRPSVVLDQSAFYPESGGQMADRGTLEGRDVTDVQIDDDDVVHHVLAGEGPLPAIGSTVNGHVDAERRRLFRALHSGQHLLSRALVELCGAETTSSRLGETTCTIDVDRAGLEEASVVECEALVQTIIDEDRGARAWFPTVEELRQLPLRRQPKAGFERIRVVDLGGFDVSPCGGTHVSHTSQIGVLRVSSVEKYKGGTRVSFSAGSRARRELFAEARALAAAGAALVVPPLDVPDAIGRLEGRLRASREELGKTRAALAMELASRARAGAEGERAIVSLDDGGADLARLVAERLTSEGALVAVVGAAIEGGVHVVVARGPESSTDCGALLRAIAQKAGGKGGGRPERAEGRLPAGAELRALV